MNKPGEGSSLLREYTRSSPHKAGEPITLGPDLEIIKQLDRIEYSITFRIGLMRKHRANALFDTLIETTLFTVEEAKYFRNICGYKLPSDMEIKLLGELNQALSKNQYDRAVALAKQIHNYELHESRTKNRIKNTMFSMVDNASIPVYFDDCPVAFELGERLSSISPLHALEAFSIITKSSPLTVYCKTKELMADLAFAICLDLQTVSGKNSNKEISEQEARKWMEIAIKDLYSVICEGRVTAESMVLFCKMLDLHSGYNPMKTETLFKNIVISDPINPFQLRLQILMTMANQLFHLLNPQSALQTKPTTQSKTAHEKTIVVVPNGAVNSPVASASPLNFMYGATALASSTNSENEAIVAAALSTPISPAPTLNSGLANTMGSGSLSDDDEDEGNNTVPTALAATTAVKNK